MTSSSLDLAWPACQKCLAHVDDIIAPSNDFMINDQREIKHSDQHLRLKVNGPAHPVDMTIGLGGSHLHHVQRSLGGALQLPLRDNTGESISAMFSEAAYGSKRQWNMPSEDEESLELPLPLRSDMGEIRPRAQPAYRSSRMFSSQKYKHLQIFINNSLIVRHRICSCPSALPKSLL